MDARGDIYLIADELRSIASLGLNFAENDYDRERYDRALSLSARMVATMDGRQEEEVMEDYRGNLSHASPLVGADAAVFRNRLILLIRREDDGLWAMPGGLTEVGETWAQSVERELREETGVEGTATKLLGVFDSRIWGSRTKFHFYGSVWLVDADDDQAPVAGPETTGVGFFSEDDLPNLSPGHLRRVPMAFKLARGDIPTPYFDSTN